MFPFCLRIGLHREDVWRRTTTPQSPLCAPAAFFDKERDYEDMEGLQRGRAEQSVGGRRGMEAVLFLDWLHHRSLPPPCLLPCPLVTGPASAHKHS